MQDLVVYSSDFRQNPKNVYYRHRNVITNVQEMHDVSSKDCVYAEYTDGHRKNANFIRSSVLPLDCDNSHSDDPANWKTPSDVAMVFKGVPFYVVYSRHHMAWKDNASPRPRFHVFFGIDEVTDFSAYRRMKEVVIGAFPFFDQGAKDASRFFYGVPDPVVELWNDEA